VDCGITGKPALVVRGSKGIGFEAAKILPAEGCRVAVLARTRTDIDTAVDAIRAQGGTATDITADISHQDEVDDAVRQGSYGEGATGDRRGLGQVPATRRLR
jgi:3-oxoacyl-[acyl-carrier protein] reductase